MLTLRSLFTSSRCCKPAVAVTSKKLAMEPLNWSWVMFLRIVCSPPLSLFSIFLHINELAQLGSVAHEA